MALSNHQSKTETPTNFHGRFLLQTVRQIFNLLHGNSLRIHLSRMEKPKPSRRSDCRQDQEQYPDQNVVLHSRNRTDSIYHLDRCAFPRRRNLVEHETGPLQFFKQVKNKN
jgi:hypothetical protein